LTTATGIAPRGKRRPRRTQAERSAATRRKIIDAVVTVIADEGFAQASAQRIAQRAGVTWGAVQYHFGTKADILDAVLAEGVARFARGVESLALEGRSLEQRVGQLMQHCWAYCCSPHYRAMLEIALNARRGAARDSCEQHQRFAQVVREAWRSALADADLDEAQRVEAERFACAVLSGLAVQAMLRGGETCVRRELKMLERATLRLLARSAR
jgi:AcrR family transcriptional regulator